MFTEEDWAGVERAAGAMLVLLLLLILSFVGAAVWLGVLYATDEPVHGRCKCAAPLCDPTPEFDVTTAPGAARPTLFHEGRRGRIVLIQLRGRRNLITEGEAWR